MPEAATAPAESLLQQGRRPARLDERHRQAARRERQRKGFVAGRRADAFGPQSRLDQAAKRQRPGTAESQKPAAGKFQRLGFDAHLHDLQKIDQR